MIKKYKKDIILIASIILFALAIFLVINLLKKPGEYVVVIYDQQEVAKYPLNVDDEILLNFKDDSYNILVIEKNKAYIKSASCPDKYCVNSRSIDQTGESITCLPNKVVIKIVGKIKDVDVVS